MIPTNPPYCAPDGPVWVRGAETTTVHTDRRGARWIVTGVLRGGRELHWRCMADGRIAKTIIVEGHPDYPSDGAVTSWGREQKRAAAAAARGYYP